MIRRQTKAKQQRGRYQGNDHNLIDARICWRGWDFDFFLNSCHIVRQTLVCLLSSISTTNRSLSDYAAFRDNKYCLMKSSMSPSSTESTSPFSSLVRASFTSRYGAST